MIVDRLGHLAVHESHHAILDWRGDSAETVQDEVEVPEEAWIWRQHIAIVIDEYRIERAANARIPSPHPRAKSIGNDVAAFVARLNHSHSLINTDLDQAIHLALTAAVEMQKALA